jgi:nitrate reductase NapE component
MMFDFLRRNGNERGEVGIERLVNIAVLLFPLLSSSLLGAYYCVV